MTAAPDILCVGSVLWDVIGRAPCHMERGSDVAGRITRLPGGVAMNIAMTLARFGLRPALLSALGHDAEGQDLLRACAAMGLETRFIYRSPDLPTDRYMAVEGANGLIAAIADAYSLEQAGARILESLFDGRLGSEANPYSGVVALDGNLTVELLQEMAVSPALARADLRVAPASPGKAERLRPFLRHGRAVLYVNREEAGLLCGRAFDGAARAARALLAAGAGRVLVTDGADTAAEGGPDGVIERLPPQVMAVQVTGAGDTFMAAHIAGELAGLGRVAALERALEAAAAHVAGKEAG
ncbi:PfkB family carbohydrate kinase [Marimonas lutisalis]|uniref:PfkB family carbohydrate kinase n=1 Tax=Marimonas lutisalis TaxID=2545756 RepID=UPI0010FA3765|nr:PfkB family carbohydrate kinase [Marimonas lutisalis]